MKKSLIALAVLAASGAAMAQSSVTVYGLMDVWVGSSKSTDVTGGVTTKTSNNVLESGGFNTSRIGFKGTEDLGGGLKANFTIETAITPDRPSASSLGSRVATVGLAGGFGAIDLGRNWTPYDDTRAMANDTFNANIASSFSTWLGYEDNPNNMIRYTSPSFGGVSGSLAYSLGEDKTAAAGSKASSITSMSLNYANGPIVAGLAYQQQKQNGANGVFSADPGILAGLNLLDPGVGGKTAYTLINGSYDFGVAKLIAGYNTVKITDAAANSAKANEYNLGVEAPLGSSLSVGAGYAQSKVKVAGVDLFKTTGYSVALKYALSKRTFAYTALTQTKVKDQTVGSTDSFKSNIFAVGIQHAF